MDKITVSMLSGCDIGYPDDDNSTPQGTDFKKMIEAGAQFCIIRAGQNVGKDPDWDSNYQGAGAAGMLRGAYWVLDYRKPVTPQIETCLSVLRACPVEIPVWLDVEYVSRWGAGGCTGRDGDKVYLVV